MIQYYFWEALQVIGWSLLATAPFAFVILACSPPVKRDEPLDHDAM